MLRHVVVFNLDPAVSPEDAADLARRLNALPAAVPTLRSMTAGVDAGLADGNADLAVVADFDDAAGWRAYQEHPDHQAVAADIRSVMAGRAASQFEV